jgi:exodeoxyribonuclease VII small subunit
MNSTEKKSLKKNLSFEEAIVELETIVKNLEGGNIPLETAIENYNRGNLLREHCEQKLADAKLKIEKVILQNNQVTGVQETEFE